MAYATPQDMIDRFTLQEVKQLAPLIPAGDPGYDVVPLNRALGDVSAEMDSYLAARFDVPLTDVPPLLVKFACDLAREALDRTGRAPVLEAGKRARAWLKDVATGKATLGSAAEGDADGVPAPISGAADVLAPDRVFDDAGLAGFLR